MTRAPDLLLAYLADRDIPCGGCGYNLRGATTVQCPECGRVIPCPPSDFVAIAGKDPASLRLACQDCGYSVTGAAIVRCPECGSSQLRPYSGNTPSRIPRWKRLPPMLIVILAGASTLVLITCIIAGFARQAGRRGTGNPWNGVLLCLLPLLLCGAWMWWRKPLARLQPAERKALTGVAIVFGMIAIAVALRTLA